MSIKKSKSKRLSKSRKLSKSKNNMVLRAYTNNNGLEKYDYITKEEADKHMKPRHKRFDKFKKSKKTKKSRKTKKTFSKRYTKHKGGFLNDPSCNIATVREEGFNLGGLGSIAGLSIPESRAVIYNPNCKADTYQAMI